MARAYNPRRAKQHRSYTVAEAADLFAVHRNTVRNWIRRGLPVVRAEGLVLLLGVELRRFLEDDAASRRQSCPPGHLYCLSCRAPRAPAQGSARVVVRSDVGGNLGALCGHCGKRMFRRVRLEKLSASGFAGVPVQARGEPPIR